jgi:hypothetical protein
MKHYLLAALLACSVPALAQNRVVIPKPAPEQPEGTEAAEVFKRANIIIIHSTDSAATAYTKLARALLADGYTIEKSDKEIGYINTQYRVTTIAKALQAALKFTITAAAGETRIEMRATGLVSSVPALGIMRVEARGQSGSAISFAWAEMQRAATLYPGQTTLTYKRER